MAESTMTLSAVRRRRFARNSTTGAPDLGRSLDMAIAEHEERNKSSVVTGAFRHSTLDLADDTAGGKEKSRPGTRAYSWRWFLRAGGLCHFVTAIISSFVHGSLFTSWAIILALECEVRATVTPRPP